MARYLSIVRTAYRATVEEQDDTALWFSHVMKNAGADVAVVLRADAVNYAVKGQDAKGLRFGERLVLGPDITRDVKALVSAKVPVYVVAEDAAERCIQAPQLLEGVESVSRSGLARLVTVYDRVLQW